MEIIKYIDRSIAPLFINSGNLQSDLEKVDRLTNAGVNSFMLFQSSSQPKASQAPISASFTPAKGSVETNSSLGDISAILETIESIKNKHSDITLIADACVCSETLTGHCRLSAAGEGKSSNDSAITMDRISSLAGQMAGAGADIISLSAMIEGQTATLRQVLDAKGHRSVKIMPAVKIASHYYQVAREIINPNAGDIAQGLNTSGRSREIIKPYHLSRDDAKRIIEWSERETAEGADILMVKPGLSSLDIIYHLKSLSETPIYAYVTTGKYRILKAGMVSFGFDGGDIARFFQEEMDSLFRSGADKVITGMIEDLIEAKGL